MTVPSQPPDPYSRDFDFEQFSQQTPNAQQPGQEINQELDALADSVNQTISRLGELQADDGKLRVSAVPYAIEQLVDQAEEARDDTFAAVAEVNAAKDFVVNASNGILAAGQSAINAQAAANASAAQAAASAIASSDSAILAEGSNQSSYQNLLSTIDIKSQAEAARNAAQAASSLASGYAVNSSQSADQALGYRNTSQSSAATATTKAGEASASASQAYSHLQSAASSAQAASNSAFAAAASAQAAEAVVNSTTYAAPLSKTGNEVSIDPAYKPNPFDQALNTGSDVVFNTVNTLEISFGGVSSSILNEQGLGLGNGTTLNQTDGLILAYAGQKIVFTDLTEQYTAGLSPADAAATYYPLTNPAGYIGRVVEVTDNTNAALRITQLGTGEALRVEDSANPDTTPTVIQADGTVCIGSSTPHVAGYKLSVTGPIVSINGAAQFYHGSGGVNITQTGGSFDACTINNQGSGASFRVNDVASDTTPFIVDAGGNVGVKTASPTTDFEVVGKAKVATVDEYLPTRFRIGDHSSLGSATVGTGASVQGNTLGIELNSPTTAVGYALRRLVTSNQCPRATGIYAAGSIPWADKRIIFGGLFLWQSVWDTNCTSRIYYGRTIGYPAGNTSAPNDPQSIELRWTGTGAMTMHCARASSVTDLTTTFTPVVNRCYDIRVESFGGSATLFVDGVAYGTNTGAPNANGSATSNVLGVVAENVATAAAASALKASQLFIDAI